MLSKLLCLPLAWFYKVDREKKSSSASSIKAYGQW